MISVSTNFEVALRHLQYQDLVRRLWVNALCINQVDNDKQLHQVEFIRLIYQEVSEVLVWLGPATDDSDLAMNCL